MGELEGIFIDDLEISLAELVLRFINTIDTGVYEDELVANVVNEQLEREGYDMSGDKYIKREHILCGMISENIIGRLIDEEILDGREDGFISVGENYNKRFLEDYYPHLG